ncbi:MAG TPA: hypothetical protein V6C97_16735 [Oculatellaceae cyanobacterium]
MSVRLYRSLGVLVGVTSSLVVVGWMADVSVLKSLLPGQTVIPANCSITWALAGWALFLTSLQSRWLRMLGRVLALLVTLTGAVTLATTLLSIDPLDAVYLQPRAESVAISFPGQMLLQESVPFMLIGIALLLLSIQKASLRIVCCVLAVAAMAPSIQALVGYVLSKPDLFTFCTTGECARLHLMLALTSITLCLSIFFYAKPSKQQTAAL